MRRLALIMFAAALMAAGTPAMAADTGQTNEKDLCLLYAQKCSDRTDSLIEKISRLKAEIAKGDAVYTPAEITRLQVKLQEAEDMLDVILYGPSNK